MGRAAGVAQAWAAGVAQPPACSSRSSGLRWLVRAAAPWAVLEAPMSPAPSLLRLTLKWSRVGLSSAISPGWLHFSSSSLSPSMDLSR